MNRRNVLIKIMAAAAALTLLCGMLNGCGKKAAEAPASEAQQTKAAETAAAAPETTAAASEAAAAEGAVTEIKSADGWKTKYDAGLFDMKQSAKETVFTYRGGGGGSYVLTVSYTAEKLPSEVLYNAVCDVEIGEHPERIQRSEDFFREGTGDWCFGRYIPANAGTDEPDRRYVGVEHNGGTLLFSEISKPAGDAAAQAARDKAASEIRDNFEWTDHRPQQEFAWRAGTYERLYAEELEGELQLFTDIVIMNADHTGKLIFQDEIGFVWTSYEIVENGSGARCEYTIEGDSLYIDFNRDGNSLVFERTDAAAQKKKAAFAPEEIHDLEYAEMFGTFGSRRIDSPEKLAWIEEHFGGAEKLNGWPNCPYEMILLLKRKDGTVFEVCPATDSCDNLKAGDVWYCYHAGNNAKLFEMFELEKSM